MFFYLLLMLLALHKDCFICDHPGFTVQLWGLYGSGSS